MTQERGSGPEEAIDEPVDASEHRHILEETEAAVGREQRL